MKMLFRTRPPPLSLALQGGGAHGAFTWGVLDALLERGVDVAALSGASAGAMNAVVLAHGLLSGTHDAARESLADFWRAVSQSVSPLWHQAGDPPSLTPAGRALLTWTRWLAPAQLNPLGLDPLRAVLAAQIDFDRLRTSTGPALFVSATEADTGRLRLFRRAELTLDALMASACLPTVTPPVAIDGRPHWDGGYCANPALLPLLRDVAANDLVLVTLNPLAPQAVPTDAAGIARQVLDIGFQAPLLREARMLAELQADALTSHWGWLRTGLDRRLARLRWHLLDADETLASLPGETRLVPEWDFLQRLRDAGRARVDAWWREHAGALGRRSSVDALARFGQAA